MNDAPRARAWSGSEAQLARQEYDRAYPSNVPGRKYFSIPKYRIRGGFRWTDLAPLVLRESVLVEMEREACFTNIQGSGGGMRYIQRVNTTGSGPGNFVFRNVAVLENTNKAALQGVWMMNSFAGRGGQDRRSGSMRAC